MKFNLKTVIGVLLLVAGILVVAYGSFTYTKKTHKAELGSLTLAIDEKETVKIPIWAGVMTIVAGAAIVVLPLKKD